MAIKVKHSAERPAEAKAPRPAADLPTPPRGIPRSPAAPKPLSGPAELKASGPKPAVKKTAVPAVPLATERGSGSGLSAAAAAQRAAAEVRRDVLETTRAQLLQSLELDPANPRIRAMLLVTLYRLGRFDAVMQALREARNRGIPGHELRAVARCRQVMEEEERAGRLPFDQHAEFLDYLGA